MTGNRKQWHAWLMASAGAALLAVAISDVLEAAGTPQIISASVDFSVPPGQITIQGQNFPITSQLLVALNGTVLHNVPEYGQTKIVASLEEVSELRDLPGDYLLTLTHQPTGKYIWFVVTIGFSPPAGPCFDDRNRFVDCANGTVSDTVTGLIWLKNANCFGAQTWPDASEAAAALHNGQCGLSDGSTKGSWRLPTLTEWQDIMKGSCYPSTPTLPDKFGSGCYATGEQWATNVQSANYWSSTSFKESPNGAWIAILSDVYQGQADKVPFVYFVWPVRSR